MIQSLGRFSPQAAGRVLDLRATPRRLLVLNHGAHVQVFDLKTRRPVTTLKAQGRPRRLQLSADGRFVLLTAPGSTNWVYGFDGARFSFYRRWKRKTGKTQGLSADGRMLIRGDVRHQVRGYELKSYKMKWLVKAETVVVSRDGRIAACLRQGVVSLVDAVNGRRLRSLSALPGRLLALALRQKDEVARYASHQGVCFLLLGSRRLRAPCLQRPLLHFSPRGGLLALTGGSRALVYRVPAGEKVADFQRAGRELRLALVTEQRLVLANFPKAGELWTYGLSRTAR